MMIDTHIHCYDPERPQGIPWPEPNNTLLYRRVLPEHYKALAVPEGVTGAVIVEASVWLKDNQWILDLAENEPFIVGFVGNLDPKLDDFGAHLNRFSANPLFRGFRFRKGSIAEINQEPIRSNLKRLADKDLELDLLVDADEIPAVASLAGQIPDLRIVINHVAHVLIDGKTPDSEWVNNMQTAAKHSNVYCKVSGLVERAQDQPAPSDPAYYVPTLDALWEAFGEDRLFYGSNWPVCERSADYATVQNIVTPYFKGKGEEAAEKYFWRNSKAAYKWIDRS